MIKSSFLQGTSTQPHMAKAAYLRQMGDIKMIRIFFFVLIAVFLTGCANLKKAELNKKDDKTKTFDLEEYKVILDSKGKKHPKNYSILKLDNNSLRYISRVSYIRKDGAYVEITEKRDSYILKEKEPNSLYTMNYYYDSKTRLLEGNSRFFYDIPVGMYIRYDNKGNVIEQINYDERFLDHCKFKIEDLVKKLQKELNVDISNSFKTINNDITEVSLYIPKSENEEGFYVIKIWGDYSSEYKVYSTLRTIRVDCITGVILIDTIESLSNVEG